VAVNTNLLSRRPTAGLPDSWPSPLHPRLLASMNHATPFLVTDLGTVQDRYRRLLASIPGIRPFYAVKCNASPEIVRSLAALGSGFEVASYGELHALQRVGIDPGAVLYSNTVKPSSHIAQAYAAGLWRFAFDSEGELRKLARHAPGSAVYVRVRVDDSSSTFPLSKKFGTDVYKARTLLQLARRLGLTPYGVTFHVGSQCATTTAWTEAIITVSRLMADLAKDGIELEMLDIGGGFPARYGDAVPTIAELGETISHALGAHLPYRPPVLAAEPGRYLVAEAGVLVTSILGREVRSGENWLYLDVGAYNGLMETQQTSTRWRFPLWSSRPDHGVVPNLPFTVTGPSCDSADTMFQAMPLPHTLDVDDRLFIGSTGAYTLSYASHFNGFAPPATLFVGGG
jgi:ornithine decarboxylase